MDSSKADDENQRNINDGDWICPDSQYVAFLEATSPTESALRFQCFNFIHDCRISFSTMFNTYLFILSLCQYTIFISPDNIDSVINHLIFNNMLFVCKKYLLYEYVGVYYNIACTKILFLIKECYISQSKRNKMFKIKHVMSFLYFKILVSSL